MRPPSIERAIKTDLVTIFSLSISIAMVRFAMCYEGVMLRAQSEKLIFNIGGAVLAVDFFLHV